MKCFKCGGEVCLYEYFKTYDRYNIDGEGNKFYGGSEPADIDESILKCSACGKQFNYYSEGEKIKISETE